VLLSDVCRKVADPDFPHSDVMGWSFAATNQRLFVVIRQLQDDVLDHV
jgi:hypothetical protein